MPIREYSDPRKYARVGGTLMIIVGALALIPGLYRGDAGLPPLNLEASYGLFLGFIAMNILNKLAVIGLGIAGVTAANTRSVRDVSLPASIRYAQVVTVITAVLAVLGMIPRTSTLFGYWPLFGANIAIYGLVALVSAYYGFVVPARMRKNREDITSIRAA
jgi:hypothetical protein